MTLRISRYWREAATLLLFGRRPSPQIKNQTYVNKPKDIKLASKYMERHTQQNIDYNILMLQRSQKSKFFPGRFVFPGGCVELADFSSDWKDIFQNVVHTSLEDIAKHMKPEGPRPPMFSPKRDSPIPLDIAFRICAIRETFEESGLLLTLTKNQYMQNISSGRPQHISNYAIQDQVKEVIGEWQQETNRDASKFIEFCRIYDMVPNVWALKEWSSWLTPPSGTAISEPPATPRRFDTIFYAGCIDQTPEVTHDEEETISSKWLLPIDVLTPKEGSGMSISGPQTYEMQRLLSLNSLEAVAEYMTSRCRLGLNRWMTSSHICSDGIVWLFPGDDAYPNEPDVEGRFDAVQLNQTVKQFRQESSRIHRAEFPKDSSHNILINFQLPYGQINPVPFSTNVSSKI